MLSASVEAEIAALAHPRRLLTLPNLLDGHRVIVTHRVEGPKVLQLLGQLRKRGARVLFDLDGTLWDTGAPDWDLVTELQAAAYLEYRMMDLGAEMASFQSIIGAGANASLPHYRPAQAKIEKNSSESRPLSRMAPRSAGIASRKAITGASSPVSGRRRGS